MQTVLKVLVIATVMAIFAVNYKTRKYAREKVDGVESIDGITYLIRNVDVSYVMYKLRKSIFAKCKTTGIRAESSISSIF